MPFYAKGYDGQGRQCVLSYCHSRRSGGKPDCAHLPFFTQQERLCIRHDTGRGSGAEPVPDQGEDERS